MYANAPWTLPSHVTLFTGLLPRASGIATMTSGNPADAAPVLDPHHDRLLPKVLRRSGYATRAVSCNLWISTASGFGTGFDEFASVDTGRQTGLHSDRLRDRLRWDLEGLRARADDGAEQAGAILRKWAAEPRGKPFFWFVNLVECHSPYLPPRPYNDLGPADRLRAAEEARRYLTLTAIWRACAGALELPEDVLSRMRHLYARAVRSMDDWLARFLDDLERGGHLDDTLVIVTSDHGENFGEDNYMGHAFSLDDRLIRVPFVAAGPVALPTSEVDSLAGVPALIAAAAGIEQHPWAGSIPPGEVAVSQFDPPGTIDHPKWQERIEEWGVTNEIEWRVAKPLTSATDGRRKLLIRGEREELYDLASDPLEMSPLDPAEAGNSVPGLEALRAAIEHPVTRAHGGTEPAHVGTAPADEDELRQLEERMKLLGYM
jgi:arylsulfatase A-like enzyme